MSSMRTEFFRLKQAWAAGQLDQGIEGGETPLGAWNRAKPFFDDLYQRHQDQKILVCSHGRTSRIVLTQLLGYGLERMEDFNHTNTGLNVLHFQPTGKVFAEKINDVTHLEETLQL
jgi:broad specificity phosphatase PhoE